MKTIKPLLVIAAISLFTFSACDKDDSVQPATPTTNNGGNTDTTSSPNADQFWLGNGAVKCTPYTKQFTQTINLLSINTEKCYQEFVRPNFTFDFPNSIGSSFVFGVGTYNIVQDFASQGNTDVLFNMSGYNDMKYKGVSGTVTVSKLATDTSIWTVEWTNINLYSEDDSSNYTFTGRIEGF